MSIPNFAVHVTSRAPLYVRPHDLLRCENVGVPCALANCPGIVFLTAGISFSLTSVVLPGITALQILGEIQTFLLSTRPRDFKGRIIFTLMFNDLVRRAKDNEQTCLANATEVTEYAKQFKLGHWTRTRNTCCIARARTNRTMGSHRQKMTDVLVSTYEQVWRCRTNGIKTLIECSPAKYVVFASETEPMRTSTLSFEAHTPCESGFLRGSV